MKKVFEPKIAAVSFCYIGKDKDFNAFLKSIIHDYLTAEKAAVVGCDEISKDAEIA